MGYPFKLLAIAMVGRANSQETTLNSISCQLNVNGRVVCE